MNRSGIAVAEFASFFKISLEDILVIHDELDLDFGRIKVKQGGGNGADRHHIIRGIKRGQPI